MDHSVVQEILDHANTRGTAILMRTIREILRDRKMVMVAFICLLPILPGLIFSVNLSDDEDIRDEDIENIRDTSDIFCLVDVPDHLPNTGNYTFVGEIRNRGDTTQEIAVNMTLGNSKTASAGVRKTTGIMRVDPIVDENETESNDSLIVPHLFHITYDMNEFKEGTTFIVIQMYVNNSFSATRLIPDEFDLTIIDFDQFNLESLVGRNDAVWVDEIRISRSSGITEETQGLFIGKETDIMPLNITYPSMVSPVRDDDIHLSYANPLNGSDITVNFILASDGSKLASHTHDFLEDMDWYNVTLLLPSTFLELDFDTEILVDYKIIYQVDTVYQRNAKIFLDVVKEEIVHLAENRTLRMDKDTIYRGSFEYQATLVREYLNTFRSKLTNNDLTERTFNTNVTLVIDEYNDVTNHSIRNITHLTEIPVDATSTITTEIIFPYLLQDLFNGSYRNQDVFVEFSIKVQGEGSNLISTDELSVRSFEEVTDIEVVSLEDTFTTSLRSYITLPEDISLKRSSYNVTCSINNTASIEKEFKVKVDLQNSEYVSDWITIGPQEKKNITITILTDDLTKQFNEELKVEVFSSRTLEVDIPEAEGVVEVNVISQGHKERKVLENFLTVYILLYMKFIVPLVAMVYGISLISEESERRTLALYLTTPITKVELVLYKFGGYLIALMAVLTIPLVLIYLSFAYVLSIDLLIYYLLLLGVCLFDLFLAVAAYGAVFTTIGTIERRPVFIGLSYLMVWEVFMGSFGFFLAQYTLFYHIRNAILPFAERYVPNAVNSMDLLDLAENEFTIPMEVAMIVLTLVVIVSLFFAVNILSSRDVS